MGPGALTSAVMCRFTMTPLSPSALLFISMCRFTLTMIRNTWIGRKFFALDMIVDIHKALGIIYAVMTVIHTGAHVFTFREYIIDRQV